MCVPKHDLLDWLAAIGPTLATFAAVGATVWAGWISRQAGRYATALQQKLSEDAHVLQRQLSADAAALQRQLSEEAAAFRRQLNAPRVHILEMINPGTPILMWEAMLRNDGLTPANLVRFDILVDGKVISRGPLEAGNATWLRVFQTSGLTLIGDLKCQTLKPVLAIPPGYAELVFHAALEDPRNQVLQAMKKVRIEIEYESIWKERFPY